MQIYTFLGNLDDLVMEDNLNFSVDQENGSPILNNPLSSSLQASGKIFIYLNINFNIKL